MDRERTPVLKMLREGGPRSRRRSQQQFAATALPSALLAALRFPPFSPVLAHPHRHRSPRRGRHRATPAPPAACHRLMASLGPAPATKQLWKLAADRRFLLTELLEPRHRAQPCEPAQLFLTEIYHASSVEKLPTSNDPPQPPAPRHPVPVSPPYPLSSPCRSRQAAFPATPARCERRHSRRRASRRRRPSPSGSRDHGHHLRP